MGIKRILMSAIVLIICSISIACGLRGYTDIVDITDGRTQIDATVIATNSSGLIVRYKVNNESFNASINEFNKDTSTGDNVKIAYNNTDYTDIVYVGDKAEKAKFFIILGLAIIGIMIVYYVWIVNKARGIKVVYGKISEVVQIIENGKISNKYYAVALGVNPVTKQIIQAKSKEFIRELKDKVAVGSRVVIRFDKGLGDWTFNLDEVTSNNIESDKNSF